MCVCVLFRFVVVAFHYTQWLLVNLSRRASNLAGVVDIPVDLQSVVSSSTDGNSAVAQALSTLRGYLSQLECTQPTIHLVHCAASHRSDQIGNPSGEKLSSDFSVQAMSNDLALNLLAPAFLTSELAVQMGEGSSVVFVGSTLSEQAVAVRACMLVMCAHVFFGCCVCLAPLCLCVCVCLKSVASKLAPSFPLLSSPPR